MIRSLALLCALFVGDAALGGNITIPTDDCTWREETYGAWNQCFGNEIVIGTLPTLGKSHNFHVKLEKSTPSKQI